MIYFGGFSGCYKPTPLKMNLVLEIWLASKQVGEVLWGKTSGYSFTVGISSKDLAFMPTSLGLIYFPGYGRSLVFLLGSLGVPFVSTTHKTIVPVHTSIPLDLSTTKSAKILPHLKCSLPVDNLVDT
jgi:hypothetical protein